MKFRVHVLASRPIVLINECLEKQAGSEACHLTSRLIYAHTGRCLRKHGLSHLLGDAQDRTVFGRRNVHRFFLQIKIPPDLRSGGSWIGALDIFDGGALVVMQSALHMLDRMTVGIVLTAALQTNCAVELLNAKLDRASEATRKWTAIDSISACTISRPIVLPLKNIHSNIIRGRKQCTYKSKESA